jgi:hypothetical protein
MDLLITMLTLVAAVYAVTPRERQLDLSLRIGLVERSILVAGFLGVMYLEFYDFVLVRGWVFKRPWLIGINPRNSIYLVMLAVAVVLWVRLKFFTRLTPGNINRFRDLVEELLWSERYGELSTLLQPHLKELFKLYHSDFLLFRIRKSLESLTTWPRLDPQLFQELLESVKGIPRTPRKKLVHRSIPDIVQ